VRRWAIGALRGSWAPPGAIGDTTLEQREATLGAEVGEVERLEGLFPPGGVAPRGPVEGAGDAAAAAADLALVLGVDADPVGGGGVEALEGVGHEPAALAEGAGDAAEPARVVGQGG
jgi:hypothetical protein